MTRRGKGRDAEQHLQGAAGYLARSATTGAWRGLAVAACSRGEGASTTAMGLARTLQRQHAMRVLLVESDRAAPTLGSRFGLDPARTLDRLMDQDLRPCECIQSADGVAVLPASWPACDVDAAVLRPALIGRVLEDVSDRFDIVIFDAPPLLDRNQDLSVAAFVGRVVLVVEAEKTRREVLDRASGELERDGVKVVGTVINRQQQVIPGWLYHRVA